MRYVWVDIEVNDKGFSVKSPKGGEVFITVSEANGIKDSKLNNIFRILRTLYNKGILKTRHDNKSKSEIAVDNMKTLYKIHHQNDSSI